jgi:hypothetical protein
VNLHILYTELDGDRRPTVHPEVNVEPYPDNVEKEVATASSAALAALFGLTSEAEEETFVAVLVFGGGGFLILGLRGGRLLVVNGTSHARLDFFLKITSVI